MTRLRFLLAAFASLIGGHAAAAPAPELAGTYDGGQMEMAAGLELSADGRFRYALSYGALDEQAQGRWTAEGGRVLLTSDPVRAPAFVALETRALAEPRLTVGLDLPAGMDRQYFKAVVTLAGGERFERQFSADGLDLRLEDGQRVVAVAVSLPIFDLTSAPAAVPAPRAGAQARFRFEPNDLGRVAFDREPLAITPRGLTFQRHDRTITFRRQGR